MDLPRPLLCLVTGASADQAGTLDLITRSIRAGIDFIQIREREMDDRSLLQVTRMAVERARGTRTRVVVNDRLDVALAAGAGGVHLRADSMAGSIVRRHAPDEYVIGRSVHSRAEAIEAERDGGYDYLIFGTVFDSLSKPAGRPSQGLTALRAVCEAVRLPVLAIGGISIERARGVAEAGAAGVAAISLFARARDLDRVVRELRAGLTPDPKVV